MTQPARTDDSTKKWYWFDKDHGNVFYRFLSSDSLRNLVTIGAVVVAFGTISITSCNQQKAIEAQQVSVDRQLESQRISVDKQIEFESEWAANQLWSDYRDYVTRSPELSRITAYEKLDKDKKVEYEGFVERLLMAADIITIKLAMDPQWEDSFAYEFRKHRSFFLSTYFLDYSEGIMSTYCTYRREVRAWLRRAFEADLEVAKTLAGAEKACQAELDARNFSHG